MPTAKWQADMMALTSVITQAITSAPGLTLEAAALAAVISAINVMRVNGLNENVIIAEARKACPKRH
jgi:hypothetical protein